MNRFLPSWRRLAAAFVAGLLAVSSAQAQVPGSPGSSASVPGGAAATPGGLSSPVPGGSSFVPGGSGYSYRSSASQSFSPSRVPMSLPGASPNISNALQSPYSTSRDTALSKRGGTDTRAHIWLKVPDGAEVWVSGIKTRQTGESRYFYSPALEPGKEYNYQVRVLWKKDGKPVEETQRILVQAGATIRRDFTK